MPPKKINVEKKVTAYTSKGAIQGTTRFYNEGRDKYHSFQCVPYAHLPIGDLRFAPPSHFRSFDELTLLRLMADENATSYFKEDFLFLCIYTPEVRANTCGDHYTRPVIVFVPSLWLSPKVPDFRDMYGGEYLTGEDVVLVVLYYRPDILGFTGFKVPSNELNVSGFNGLHDIVAGLNFVKNEIRNFGGCPENITAYGHGRSCRYVRMLNTRPFAGRYFHKMILSSSMDHSIEPVLLLPQYDMRQVAEVIGPDKNFDDDKACVDYLRNVPIDVLLDHSKPMFSERSERIVYKNNLISVQGDISTWQMPVLVGFNSMEGLIERTIIQSEHLDPVEYLGRLLWLAQTKSTRQKAAKNAAKIIEVYRHNLQTIGCSHDIYLEMIETDIKYLVGIINLATSLARDMHLQNVYLYQFAADLSKKSKWNQCDSKYYPGVGHGDELKFLFNSTCDVSADNTEALNPVDKAAIVKQMTKIWAQFAKTGNPNPTPHTDTWGPIGERLTHYYEIRPRSVVYREFSQLEKIRFQLWEKIYGMDFFSTHIRTLEPKKGLWYRLPVRIPMHARRRPVVQSYKNVLPKLKPIDKMMAYTSKGPIQGNVFTYKDLVYNSFQHVPYAQVPVGKLRFAAPRDIGSFNDFKSLKLDANGRYGLEDNLFLHIYTPEVREKKSDEPFTRPVIVFVPGRLSNEAEQYRSEDLYGPQFLLEEDVVLVVLSYRRGILGFTAFDEPNAELNVPIDAGIQDIVRGFRFVKKEIRHFGGCPDNVTAYGQGTGAAHVRRIAARFGEDELFHKMILSSSLDHAAGIELPIACYNVRYLVQIQAPSLDSTDDKACIEFLRNVPIAELLKRDYSLLEQSTKYKVVRTKHMQSLSTEKYETTMPVMIGYNSLEGLIQTLIAPNNSEEDARSDVYQVAWSRSVDDDDNDNRTESMDKVINDFYTNLSSIREYADNDYLHNDACFVVGTIALATHFAKAMAPENVYLYRFEIDLDCNFTKKLYGGMAHNEAAHADELGYIFKTPLTRFIEEDSYNDMAVKRVTKLWAQFARTGDPNPLKRSELLDVVWRPIGKKLTSCCHISTRYVKHARIRQPEAERFRLWESVLRSNFFSEPLRTPAEK